MTFEKYPVIPNSILFIAQTISIRFLYPVFILEREYLHEICVALNEIKTWLLFRLRGKYPRHYEEVSVVYSTLAMEKETFLFIMF